MTMPTNQQDKPAPGLPTSGQGQRDARISRHVLGALGRPVPLRGVHVRQLWEDHYRVNVLVGEDAAQAYIAHSYFLVTDGDGNILTVTPKIMRRYD
jgi:predicted NBD/HSP70 family sugar kinase